MTPNELARICGATLGDASKYAQHLTDAMAHFKIVGNRRVGMFLAQVSFESGRLSRVEENMGYSAKRLMAVWPRRFPTLEVANQYAMQPQKLANFVYGGRMGNSGPNDGWRYRGRGLKQLTGHDNYLLATRGLAEVKRVSYLDNPDLVAQPEGAAWTAAWFWWQNGLSVMADNDQYERITRTINGGLIGHEDGNDVGMDDRVEYYQHVKAVLEGLRGVVA